MPPGRDALGYLAAIHAVGAAVAADCGRRPLGRCRRSSSVACSWTWPLCPTLAAWAPTRWPGPMTPRSRRRRDPDATQAGLVARARAGHMHAFGQLACACADRLVAALLRLLGDRNEAENVAQEVLLRAWRGWNQPLSGPLQVLFAWLYRIVINQASRSLRASARRAGSVPIGADMLRVSASANDEPFTASNSWSCGRNRALRDLPLTCRTAIALRDVKGLQAGGAGTIGIDEAAPKAACTRRA
jgi:RNA polymerase sigma-70 factor (ECF subfamily)